MNKKEKIFAYGTLNDPAVQKLVWGRETVGTPDALADFAMSRLEIEGGEYPLAIPQGGVEVAGYVFEVTPAELEKIDAHETAAYRRERRQLKSGATAWVYLNR